MISTILLGFLCAFGTLAYAQESHHSLACEGNRAWVTCPPGKDIEVQDGFYGRDDISTCHHSSIRTTACKAGNSLQKLKNSCNGRHTCRIYASNSVFGDPCYGTYKYIRMTYKCLPRQSKVFVACEGSRVRLSCPYNKVIKVLGGFYGRDDGHTCPHSSIRTTSCSAGGSLSKLYASCHNKNTCTLSASNTVFGDPCHGTYKYIKLLYNCVSR